MNKLNLSKIFLLFAILLLIGFALALSRDYQDHWILDGLELPFIFFVATFAIVFYFIGLMLMIKYQLNIISIAFWFCYISNTLITIFINRSWKISAHAIGAAGPFAAITFVFGWLGLMMLPIVILVGWARIELKCHTISQVVAGILLAFISVYLQMFLITKYF